MQLRRHKDIIAVKNGNQAPVAFHARNLEVASVSEEIWSSMAPTTFDNGFLMSMLPEEKGVIADAFESLEDWQNEVSETATTVKVASKVTSLTLNVTQLCNLHCTYCAAGGDGTYGDPVAKISVEKTLPQIQYFLNKLSSGDQFQITFLGGEPLLYPEAIKHIAFHATELGTERGIRTRFNVITNATLITPKASDILTAIKANVTVSIDGPPETHDKARPQKNGEGSAAAAIRGLELLLTQKSNLGRIQLHAVFSKNNLEVEKAYRFFKNFEVDYYEFTFDITESEEQSNRIFMQEMAKVANLAYQSGGEIALRKIVLFDQYFQALDDQKRSENHCGSGKSLLSIDSKNKIYACPLDVGTKANQVGDMDNVEAARLEELQSPLIKKNNCDTCWARFLCGGGCLFAHKSMTGNKHRKHVSFCERTRYLISLTLLYYEQCRG
ncbi:radical SAM/SPASM domain-containing protein [Bdellovibrio bacteriovorus]|uniref:Radical SAM/SPASM domain-containing protein n=1 Tax=Bdellovibrio bacteriovorus TaxID=959 RepID=A0A150WVB5_BDEBC|nr:radical SAM protein [Bdellovibrio bacteriovorus]KYG70394.1 radical SAM/SPASM domain-containing protein [Bdellovibrio bacteriovorus]